MRTLLIALFVAALPASVYADEQKPPQPAVRQPRSQANPCAAFGPGFVQVEGSSTCVRIGGAISVDTGLRR